MISNDHDRRVLIERSSILHFFDRDLLCFVLECDHDIAESILSAAEIEILPNGFRLRPDIAKLAYARLVAEDSSTVAAVHLRAFLFYLARLQHKHHDQHSPEDEQECMHHLNQLFVPLLTQRKWQTIRSYALQMLKTCPQRPQHRMRLQMFLGYAEVHLHKYARAETLLHKLLNQPDAESDIQIKALKALADSSWLRTRYGEALTRYEQMYQAALAAGDEIYQGIALLNRASVFHELEIDDRALEDCERSLAIFREHADWTREAHALYHAALISLHLGRWEETKRYAAEAKLLFERPGMQGYLGFIFWCEGFLAHIFGDEQASEAAYMLSLTIAESDEADHTSLIVDVCVSLGILYHASARYQLALHYYQRGLTYARSLDRQHQVCLILFRIGQIFESTGRKGRAFLTYRSAIKLVERLGNAIIREDVKINLLGTTQHIFGAMVLLCTEFFEQTHRYSWIVRAFSYVEQARSRAFLDSLAGKHHSMLSGKRRINAVELSELQENLPEDALLIEYFTTGVLPRGDHLLAYIPDTNHKLRAILMLPARILAFAISSKQCELFLPTLSPNSLRPHKRDSYPGRHLLLDPMPRRLYKQLIEPVAHMLTAKRLLYLIPHGPLHYIPFAALRTPLNSFLLDLVPEQSEEGLALAQATSATILVRRCLKHPASQATRVLSLGYNQAEGEQPLRFAEAEAEHISQMLGGQAWTGPQPKRDSLREQGQELYRLHIAGHALFTPDDPMGSWLQLGQHDRLSAREIIDEISLNADLITLSSCTSGLSHVVPGDELLGLPRAFLLSGAPTVVCSRWEAVDIVTLLIMDRFYTELQQHSPAVALRNAQVAVRELSVEQLETIFGSWIEQGGKLAEAIGDPSLLLNDLAMIARYPSGSSDPPVSAPTATQLLQEYSSDASLQLNRQVRPFDKPVLWASFMVIGKG